MSRNYNLITISALVIAFTIQSSSAWINQTLHNDHGESVVKHIKVNSNYKLFSTELDLQIYKPKAGIADPLPHKHETLTSDTTHFLATEHLNPIILVPDYKNSALEATIIKNKWSLPWCKNKWDYYQIWFKIKNFKPYWIDCWASAFRLHYDLKHRRTYNTPGVDIRPSNFGTVQTVEHSLPKVHGRKDYFHQLVEALTGLGYGRDQNLMAAPYDFRIAPHENDEFFYFFKKLIEASYAMNHKKPVILVCHGVGCFYTYYFLRNQPIPWKAHFVRAMVSVGTAWGGSFQGLFAYLDEDDELITKLIPAIRYAERTYSTAAFQLPHPNFYGNEVLVQTVFRNYTALDYRDVFAGLGYPNAYNMWVDSSKILAEFAHPEVDVFCLAGIGFKTMESVLYKKAIDLSDEKGLKRRQKRRVIYGNGDGRTNLKSARRCLAWQHNYGFKFHYTEFKSKHDDLLRDTYPISHILNIVTSLRHAV